MTLDSLTDSRLWLVAGWTMLHFFWIGTLVGMVAAVGRWLLRGRSANVRYVFALSVLAALAALPVCIAVQMTETLPPPAATLDLKLPDEPPVVNSFPAAADMPEVTTSGVAGQPVTVPTAAAIGAADRFASLLDIVPEYLPWLWLIGAPLTFALLATGLVGADRLRRQSLPLSGGHIPAMCSQLAESLRISRRVTLAVCERVASPILIGIVRPMILLPPAALTGWTAEQVEMVLLHELAHVRRWDNLINLAQRVIESLLFFHPAVWLASASIAATPWWSPRRAGPRLTPKRWPHWRPTIRR